MCPDLEESIWLIQASKDIKKGEELKINYNEEMVTEKERQLRKTKFKMK